MKIRAKLLFNVVISIGLSSILSLSFAVAIANLQKETEYHHLAMEMNQAVFNLNILSNDYLAFRLDRALIQWDEAYHSGLSILGEIEDTNKTDHELVKDMRVEYEKLSILFNEEVVNYEYEQKLINEGATEEELAVVREFQERKISQLLIASQAIVSNSNKLQKETQVRLHESFELNKKTSILILSILFGFIGVSSIKLSNDISTPLSKLRSSVIKFGKGDLSAEAPFETRDEFGDLAKNFNDMARNLKKYENQLKLSAETLKRAQEIAHLGSWHLDLVHNNLTWSDEIYRIFGLTPQEFEASYEAFLEMVHPDDKNYVDITYKDAVKSKLPYEIEHRILRKNGEVRIVHERGVTKYDKAGNALSSTGTVLDITERKMAENALSSSNNALKDKVEELAHANAQDEAILQSIGDAVVACNSDGDIIIFNKAAQELTGYNSEDALGQDYQKILHFNEGNSDTPSPDRILETLKSGNPALTTSNLNLVQKKGGKVPIADKTSPILDSQNRVIGCVIVFRDISRELEIDKMKTEFVSVASHQLRTPLAILFWALEEVLGEESENLNTKQKDYLSKALKANNRMIKLVNALLNIARLESGSLGLHPVPTNVAELVQKVIDGKKFEDQDHKCKISLNIPKSTLPVIEIDPELITEALNNILSNSIKYTSSDQKTNDIAIEISINKSVVEISVQDSGIGIPKENQGHIFEKFFRADNAMSLAIDGTGLGLYITKLIVEASGGEIWIESPPASKGSKTGTLVTFSLPISGSKPRKGDKTLT